MNLNLKLVKSKYPLVVFCSNDLDKNVYNILDKNNIQYHILQDNLKKYKQNHHFDYTFDKIQLFDYEQYKKIVYLDCDILIIKNLDHLFDFQENWFSAILDAKHFSLRPASGVMVLSPSKNLYQNLKQSYFKILENYNKNLNSIDFILGDENILFSYLGFCSNIHLLPAVYNLFPETLMRTDPTLKNIYNQTQNDIYIYHFPSPTKPWMNVDEYPYFLSSEQKKIYKILLEQVQKDNEEFTFN